MDIPLRAGVDAFLTLEAIPFHPDGIILRKADTGRTFFRTCFTAFDAVLPVTVQRELRQYWKQGKNSSHRAEIPAEKTLLQTHANDYKQ